MCPFCACSAAAFAAAFCLRFCFLRFTAGAGAGAGAGSGEASGSVGANVVLEAVGVEGCEESDAPFGTVMNLEPSLLVYLAFRGDAGGWLAGF